MIYLDQYVTNQDGSRSTVSVAVGRNGYVSQRVHLNAGLNEFVIRVVSESGVYSEDYYIDIFRTTANLDPEWAKIANENTVKPDPYAAFMPMSGSAVQGSFGSYVMGDVDPALNAKPTLNFLPQDTESVIALVTMYRKDANGLYTESKTTRPTNSPILCLTTRQRAGPLTRCLMRIQSSWSATVSLPCREPLPSGLSSTSCLRRAGSPIPAMTGRPRQITAM